MIKNHSNKYTIPHFTAKDDNTICIIKPFRSGCCERIRTSTRRTKISYANHYITQQSILWHLVSRRNAITIMYVLWQMICTCNHDDGNTSQCYPYVYFTTNIWSPSPMLRTLVFLSKLQLVKRNLTPQFAKTDEKCKMITCA